MGVWRWSRLSVGARCEACAGIGKASLEGRVFSEFNERTGEHRNLRPDGQWCNSFRECAFYDVEATFTGRFFSGKPLPWRKGLGCFGHMSCCHLFMIEQIADIAARPTAVPPESQRFECTSESWQSEFQPVPTDNSNPIRAFAAHLEATKRFLIEEVRAHDGDSSANAMEQDSLQHFVGLTGATWSSPDLLTTYRIKFPSAPRLKAGSKHQGSTALPIPVTVVGEHCAPLPTSLGDRRFGINPGRRDDFVHAS